MNTEESYIERVENYVLQRMTEEEALQFEKDLLQDQELKKYYEELLPAIRVAQFHRANELKEFIRKNAKKPVKYTFWPVVITYSAAASLIFFVIAWVWIDLHQPAHESALARTREKILHPWGNKNEDIGSSQAIKDSISSISEIPPKANNQESLSKEEESEIIAGEQPPAIMEDQSGDGISEMANSDENISETDDLKVKSDEKILDTVFVAMTIFDRTMDTVSGISTSELRLAAKSKTSSKKPAVTEADTYKNIPNPSVSNKNIYVEFWKSPINYRGYRFNGRNLIIFGFTSSQGLQFKYYNNDVYMLVNKQVYRMENNDRFNSYYPEEDAKLLKLFR